MIWVWIGLFFFGGESSLWEPRRAISWRQGYPRYETLFARNLRIDSPRKPILCAVCTMRSSTASARYESPNTAGCHKR
jgi:hypothetical protein